MKVEYSYFPDQKHNEILEGFASSWFWSDIVIEGNVIGSACERASGAAIEDTTMVLKDAWSSHPHSLPSTKVKEGPRLVMQNNNTNIYKILKIASTSVEDSYSPMVGALVERIRYKPSTWMMLTLT